MSAWKTQIGFSQRIRLEWFEKTANLILAGNERAAINDALQELLRDKLSVGGKAIRGNREKVITILLKTWLAVPRELEKFRDEGLEILQGIPRENRIAVHWGMAMAAYPFWGAVAAHTGRLLRLQGTAAAGQVQRRVKEEYGERESVARAARRVLRSFFDWGVLKETDAKGVYGQENRHTIEDPRIVAWMAEASLRARMTDSAAVKDLIDSPSLFPFTMDYIPAEHLASISPRLNIVRHGLDDDLAMLR